MFPVSSLSVLPARLHERQTADEQVNNVIIGQITPIGLQNLTYRYFFLFIATNTTNGILAYFLFPETKGKTLEEIGLLFGDTDVRTMPEQRSTLEGGVHKVVSGMDEEKGATQHINSMRESRV